MPDSQEWTLGWLPAARKQLDRLPKLAKQRVLRKLAQLLESDHPVSQLKQLKGDWAPFYSLRVQEYRVIIDVEDDTFTLVMIKFGHRKNVYDD